MVFTVLSFTPQLKSLHLKLIPRGNRVGLILSKLQTLRSLQHLALHYDGPGFNDGLYQHIPFEVLADALTSGSWPNLRQLRLCHMASTITSPDMAIKWASRLASMPLLHTLSMMAVSISDALLLAIVGTQSQLKQLNLSLLDQTADSVNHLYNIEHQVEVPTNDGILLAVLAAAPNLEVLRLCLSQKTLVDLNLLQRVLKVSKRLTTLALVIEHLPLDLVFAHLPTTVCDLALLCQPASMSALAREPAQPVSAHYTDTICKAIPRLPAALKMLRCDVGFDEASYTAVYTTCKAKNIDLVVERAHVYSRLWGDE